MTWKRILVGVSAALTLAATPVASGQPSSYTDPAGDNGAAADISGVAVELAADGYLHVKPSTANMPELGSEGWMMFAVDADRNSATGSIAGAEYVLIFWLDEAGGTFMKWDGAEYAETPVAQGDVRFLLGGGSFEFLVRPAVLGGATAFNFIVGAATGVDDAAQLDIAPDRGAWFFEPTAAVELDSINARFATSAPRAGKPFSVASVRLTLATGETVVAEQFRCVATLGGKPLRGSGKGGCTFKLPTTAKGKRLSVRLSATYKGVTDDFKPYVFRVR